MSYDDLLVSIAETIKDYREGEIEPRNEQCVDRWVQQFESAVRRPLLVELDWVFKQTYLSRAALVRAFTALVKKNSPVYWKNTHFLQIQQNGNSQNEMLSLLNAAMLDVHGFDLGACVGGERYMYLDDISFTGNRITNDLIPWIKQDAPKETELCIASVVRHSFGAYQAHQKLEDAVKQSGKSIHIDWRYSKEMENRKTYRDDSDVLWPSVLPGDVFVQEYLSAQKYPFEPRNAASPPPRYFSSEEGRQLLEREMLLAGLQIRSFCQNPKEIMRPLGYGPFGLGFGSTWVTYRNCPNNAPLAFWWGDPDYPTNHPFSRWYPLFPRKTYDTTNEGVFDDFA
ncbi:hypothetical protein L6R29_13925 [Myxococcota bacterium]|nr:hypothetical protein [Myxococcota bacterium]